MSNINNGDGFDKLVSELSSDDRKMMLKSLNKNLAPSVKLVEIEQNPANQNITLKIKFENESIFYKIFLWFRSLIEKKETNQVYNEDVISRIAKKVNKEHPGILDHRNLRLDTIFYQRLIALREAADFFRPYLSYVSVNPGDFYVFLSSFVTPEIESSINANADPFSIPFEEDSSVDKRNEMLKKLDDVLNEISGVSRSKLYESISAVNWLDKFTRLPFLHFVSQFTNIVGGSYTAPYKNCVADFDAFASLFCDIDPVDNVILEAVFLYSKKKEIDNNKNIQNKDVEKAIKEFLVKANGKLGLIQMFITSVPILKIGKIVNSDYDWSVNSSNGVEAWFPAFRLQWRKIIDERWNDWIRERKKKLLADSLNSDFYLEEFPAMKYRPWNELWMRVPFAYELTGGFISWFATEVFDDIIPIMNDVMLEGVFLRNENRTEYSEALNNFVQANKEILELLEKLSPEGEWGILFDDFATNKVRTLQIQNQIESMISSTETIVHEAVMKFMKSVRIIELIYKGFFDDQKDGIHETLQNWSNIKGHQNREWKDKLYSIYHTLKKSLFYLSELEPIDASTKDI